MRCAYKVLFGEPEEMRPLGTRTGVRRWDDNIKMDVKEVGFGNEGYIHCLHEKNH
jgi:hypothetical protein